MKVAFIVKPPLKEEYKREFLAFERKFKEEIKEEFTGKEGPNNAKNLAKKAVEEGFERIVVVGGDGLLNETINGIAEATGGKIPQDFTLGIIPTGSGNNFAKALGIPKDIKKAFEIIKKERTTLVDIGRVYPVAENSCCGANKRCFINCFSVGFDALVNKKANDLKEKHSFLPKDLSYLLAAIKEIIINIPNFEVRIEGDGISYKQRIILAAITNGPTYGAIFKVNPGASVNDGKLNLCLIESVGKLRAFYDIYRVIRGTHVGLPEFKFFKISSLTISSSKPLPYEMDGEVLEPKREYKIKVLPRALNILTP